MKKSFLICLFFIFFGLASAQENLIPNGYIISKDIINGHAYNVISHRQELKINLPLHRIIYGDIFSKNKIGEINTGDKISIREIVVVDNKEFYFRIKTDKVYGYITGFNPYENGKGLFKKIVISGDKIYHSREYCSTLLADDGTKIYRTPGENSEILGIIESYSFVETVSITYEQEYVEDSRWDDNWLEIEYNEKKGWVFGGNLSAERGGYKYLLPEWDIQDTFVEYEL